MRRRARDLLGDWVPDGKYACFHVCIPTLVSFHPNNTNNDNLRFP